MTRSKLIIPVVVALAGAAAFWFLVLSPKREEIAKLNTDITQKESEAQQSEQQAALYAKAKDNSGRTTRPWSGSARRSPGDDDVRSLMYQIDDAASRAKVDFRSMSVTGSAAPGETAV